MAGKLRLDLLIDYLAGRSEGEAGERMRAALDAPDSKASKLLEALGQPAKIDWSRLQPAPRRRIAWQHGVRWVAALAAACLIGFFVLGRGPGDQPQHRGLPGRPLVIQPVSYSASLDPETIPGGEGAVAVPRTTRVTGLQNLDQPVPIWGAEP
jgi:hypothetical protein